MPSNFIVFVFLIYFLFLFFLLLYSFYFSDFFLNFIPKHLISFDFMSNFGSHSFNYFFIYIYFLTSSFFGFSIHPLIIFFHIVFILYLVYIVLIFNCFMVEYFNLLFFVVTFQDDNLLLIFFSNS